MKKQLLLCKVTLLAVGDREPAVFMQGTTMNCYVATYTLENPQGERREVIVPTIPQKIKRYHRNGTQIFTADDLVNQ